MKVIPSSRRRHYLAGVSIILVAVALIAGTAGCDGNGESYTLTITSTPGGSVVEPGEGTFVYDEGTVVNLVAEADEGYQFVNWSGGLLRFADLRSAATTIVMDNDYSISANFAVPILVWDWYDLNAIRDGLRGIYILMNDLDSTTPGYEELASPTANQGKGWEPIRTTDDLFTGIFDGQGYEISDLFINRPDQNYVGLFYSVEEGGVIENVGVVNANVTGTQVVGGLMGFNYGTVSNSYSTGNVTADSYVGGLMGVNDGTVSNSYSSGNVTGDVSGGLVGFNEIGTVINSYSTGNVTGTQIVGGLMGFNYGTVSNSYSTSNVTGTQVVGGLMGFNDGTVSNSYSTGNVTGDEDVGSLVGDNWDTVSNSFWNTETSGQSTSDGGTGKTTAEMRDIATFSGAGWDIVAVANPGTRNPSYIWNIVNNVTYPFLSWQP